MSKAYICNNCGYKSVKWLGKCPNCGKWDSFTLEEIETSKKILSSDIKKSTTKAVKITEVNAQYEERIHTNIDEFDRVLGGGIVPGSLILISGEPGIGKSTLLLQISKNLEKKILIISGEESFTQIKLRADRLKINKENIFLFCDNSLENSLIQIESLQPEIVIIDSIQTIASDTIDAPASSISQIKHCSHIIQKIAKQKNITFLLVGHITKDGSIAGPKILEHLVDVVLQIDSDNSNYYRILRSYKNRFGAVSEIGLFQMTSEGLVELKNPYEFLIPDTNKNYSGIAITTLVEGSRVFLIEIQALVSNAAYGVPQRNSTTFDPKKLNLILAVLEKKLNLKFGSKDVFINISGGLKISDTSADLAVIAAILSSYFDISIPTKYCFCGEISLSGEIKPVPQIDARIKEAQKLGFNKIFVAKNQSVKYDNKVEIIFIDNIKTFVKLFLEKNL